MKNPDFSLQARNTRFEVYTARRNELGREESCRFSDCIDRVEPVQVDWSLSRVNDSDIHLSCVCPYTAAKTARVVLLTRQVH